MDDELIIGNQIKFKYRVSHRTASKYHYLSIEVDDSYCQRLDSGYNKKSYCCSHHNLSAQQGHSRQSQQGTM